MLPNARYAASRISGVHPAGGVERRTPSGAPSAPSGRLPADGFVVGFQRADEVFHAFFARPEHPPLASSQARATAPVPAGGRAGRRTSAALTLAIHDRPAAARASHCSSLLGVGNDPSAQGTGAGKPVHRRLADRQVGLLDGLAQRRTLPGKVRLASTSAAARRARSRPAKSTWIRPVMAAGAASAPSTSAAHVSTAASSSSSSRSPRRRFQGRPPRQAPAYAASGPSP